ncbi:MAG: hypothetical protein PW845_07180 [Pseudomonas sp.]|nr:hypothetical protein [Pseudomonas sp.]
MKTAHICLLSLLAASLATAAHADLGVDTAQAMQAQYNDTRSHCDGAAAFKCSGIFLRTTKPSDKYHTWDPSPNAVQKGGVSFSYLRADAQIDRLAEGARSGFTLAPVDRRPSGTQPYKTLCAYPTDGDSWERDKNGCGNNAFTPQVKENLCHRVGINNAQDWIAHYNNTPKPEYTGWQGNPDYRYATQCAFDVRDEKGAKAADNFHQALQVMQLMKDRPFPWNEIMIETWSKEHSGQLPIQSFFHITGQQGLADARSVQQDWHKSTGKFVPVIEITLPQGNRTAQFIYRADDQAVKP